MTKNFLSVLGFIFFTSFANPGSNNRSSENEKNEHKPKEKITILVRWQMPDQLHEISGICWVDKERLACVQDELGVVFIYNILSAKIENLISFANPGDFESITRMENTYYVMRSDGNIFEINSLSKKPVVKQYVIPIDQINDLESIFYDNTKKQLLIINKYSDPQTPAKIKGIYSFNLSTNILNSKPVYKIDLSSLLTDKMDDDDKKEDKKKKEKKLNKVFLPSDIAINPKTSDIYIIDGTHSSLLITDTTGKIKSYIKLDKDDFPQPEGLTFSPEGDMFISSEGKNKKGIIAKVKVEIVTKKVKKE